MDWAYLGIELIKTAALYTVLSIAINLLWNSNKFFDFGHTTHILLGAYAYLSVTSGGFPWWIAFLSAVAVSIAVAILTETLVYTRLRQKQAEPLMCMIASFGIMVIVQGALMLRFGTQSYTLLETEKYSQFLGTQVSETQLTTITLCILIGCGVYLLYLRTKLGLWMRATADSTTLALATGVPINRTRLVSIIIASLCTGTVGLLYGLNNSITPSFAMPLLLDGFVVAMIFGLGNVTACVYGALILSALQITTVWFVGAGWSEALSFLCLITLLLVRSSQKLYGVSYSS